MSSKEEKLPMSDDVIVKSDKLFDSETKIFFEKYCALFPNAYQKMIWRVYVLSRKTFGHWSLMFEHADTENALAIELLKTERMEDGNIKVIIRFLVMDTKKYPDLRNGYVGEITSSGFDIFAEVLKVLRAMGSHGALVNNCQDYIDELATNLGVPINVKGVIDHEIKGVTLLTEVGQEAATVFLIFHSNMM